MGLCCRDCENYRPNAIIVFTSCIEYGNCYKKERTIFSVKARQAACRDFEPRIIHLKIGLWSHIKNLFRRLFNGGK